MFITPAMIRDFLEKKDRVLRYGPQTEPLLRRFRLWEEGDADPGCLYILSPEELAARPRLPGDGAILCPGLTGTPPETELPLLALPGEAWGAPLFNRLEGLFDRYRRWEEALTACPLSLEGIGQMLRCSREVLGGAIILADYRFNYVACTADFAPEVEAIRRKYGGQTPPYIVEELLTNPEYIRVQNSRQVFPYPIHTGSGMVSALCCNLFRGDEEEYRGRLLFVPDLWPCPEYVSRLLEFLGQKVNAAYSQLSDHDLHPGSQYGLRELILRGLEGQMGSVSLVGSVLRYARWNLQDEYQLLKLQPCFYEQTKEINAVSRTQLEILIPHSCAVIHQGCIVVVVNRSRIPGGPAIHEKLSKFLREHLYKVGISCPFQSFLGLSAACLEAEAALTLGNSRDSMFWYYNFPDYALDYILDKSQEQIPGSHLCLPGLLRLRSYDAAHGTAYTQALRCFVEEKYSATHAARKLYIHRTTFLKHLSRIREITALDLDHWEIRLHLMLSFQLLG